MLMGTTHTHAQRASKEGMVLAGVSYLDMLLKSRLDGQKRRYQLQTWEVLRYNSSALHTVA